MKKLLGGAIVAVLASTSVLSVSAVDVENIDFSGEGMNVGGLSVNGDKGDGIATGEDLQVGNGDYDVRAKDVKFEGEHGAGEPKEEASEPEKMIKTDDEATVAEEKGAVENKVELNAAGAEDDMTPTSLPKTGAEEIILLIMALALAGAVMIRNKKVS